MWSRGASLSATGVALALLCGSLSGCKSKLERLVERLEDEAKLSVAAEPQRKSIVTRDPESGLKLAEHSLLIDADGRMIRDGVQREWYADGQPKTLREFVQGEPTGQWISWWRNGILRFAHAHEAGVATPMTWWHPSGVIEAEGSAIAGLRVGRWVFRSGAGVLESEGAFEDGRRSGEWTLFGADGVWRERGEFVGGARVGEWRLNAGR